jgi:hypothetical protein
LSTIDKKSIAKHVLTSLQQQSDGVLSEFNALSNEMKSLMSKELKWRQCSKQLSVALTSIKRNLQTFLRAFREEMAVGLDGVNAISQSYQQVLKARLIDKSNKTKEKRGVIDMLLNGVMGAEMAEWIMIFREHADSVSNLPSLLEMHVNGISRVLETEIGKISTVLTTN